MSKHTDEPWYIDRAAAMGGAPIICADTCWRNQKRRVVKVLYHAGSEDPEVDANAHHIVACVNECRGINPKAVPELLAACCMEADDMMDGDLLSIVGCWLLDHADAVDKAYDSQLAHPSMLRNWAGRLMAKQAAQAAAIALAEEA